jgi:hypothetical protein
MIPGAFPIDPQAPAAVEPDCYAGFRPVEADGLTFFPQRLPPARLAELLRAPAELPAEAELPRRLVLFLHACPALHAIRRVVARNRHLDPGLCRHLRGLESREPHTPAGQWRPALARELAPAAREYRIRVAECPPARPRPAGAGRLGPGLAAPVPRSPEVSPVPFPVLRGRNPWPSKPSTPRPPRWFG